jgi:tRNA/tmRNA/rRNA uracil-C5-methylase (TrmA/RlmC/RlmD family)
MNNTVKIKDVALGGTGVASFGEKVVFVPGVLTGEVITLKGINEKKNRYTASVKQEYIYRIFPIE